MNSFEQVITWMDWVTIIFAFFAMFFAGKSWWSDRKKLDKVPIYFNDKKLNLDITRKEFSRQELQGILGILRSDMTKNYHIDFLTKIEYLDTIYKIQIGEMSKLVIEITDKEKEQFKDEIYETNI